MSADAEQQDIRKEHDSRRPRIFRKTVVSQVVLSVLISTALFAAFISVSHRYSRSSETIQKITFGKTEHPLTSGRISLSRTIVLDSTVGAAAVATGPAWHPYELKVNGILVSRWGSFDGTGNQSRYFAKAADLGASRGDTLHFEIDVFYGGFGQPAPDLYVGHYTEVHHRAWVITLLNTNLVFAIIIVVFFLGVLNLVFWIFGDRSTRTGLLFAIVCITVSMGYSIHVLDSPLFNGKILYSLTRGFLILSPPTILLLFYDYLNHPFAPKLRRIVLGVFSITPLIIFMPTIVAIELFFLIAMLCLAPVFAAIFYVSYWSIFKEPTWTHMLTGVGAIIMMLTSSHDLLHLLTGSYPLFWMSPYSISLVALFVEITFIFEWRELNQIKILTAKLEQARIRAEESARLKADFLANMSHEIRTPMNAIIGMTHLAILANPQQKISDYLSKIHKSSQSLLGIINDILDFSKIEAGKLNVEQIDFRLDEVIANMSSVVGFHAQEKGIELLVRVDGDVPECIVGDPLRLGQVLLNLVSNAIKFTSEGSVTLSISCSDLSEHTATLQFSVEDSGIGMDENEVSALFQSFTQADTSTTRRFGGTGLGLSISKKLVELMNGRISVRSTPGKGSVFTIQLPVEISQSPQSASVQNNPMAYDLSGLNILVVDDNPGTLDVISEILGQMGIRCTTATGGKDAIELTRQSSFSMAIIDRKMPLMNGFTLGTALRDAGVTFPMLLMTSDWNTGDYSKEIEESAFLGVILKPLNQSTLLNSIVKLTNVPLLTEHREGVDNTGLFRGLKILLAEDNEFNQQIACELLERVGASVTIAQNGEQALNLALAQQWDLVLMDIQMPVMDGYDAAKMIRKSQPADELPIIAMTANAMSRDIERCFEAGMQGHIAKPVETESFYATIARWGKDRPHYAGEQAPVQSAMSSQDVLLPPDHPHITIEKSLARFGANRRLLDNLLRRFMDSQDTLEEQLRELIDQGRLSEARRLAHTLKGMAGTLECAELRLIATQWEKELSQGTTELTRFEEGLAIAAEIVAHLNSFYTGHNQQEPDRESIDPDALLAQLRAIREKLSDADTGALRELSILLPVAGLYKELVDEIHSYCSEYDFESAITALDRAVSEIQTGGE